MTLVIALLFIAAPLVLIHCSQKSWITERQKKLLTGGLFMAMILITGLGMVLEGSSSGTLNAGKQLASAVPENAEPVAR